MTSSARFRCALPLLALACADPGTGPGSFLAVTAADSAVALMDTARLTAWLLDARGQPVSRAEVNWSSFQLAFVGTAVVPIFQRSPPPTTTDAAGRARIGIPLGSGGRHHFVASTGRSVDTISVLSTLPPPVHGTRAWRRLPRMPVAGRYLGTAIHGRTAYATGYFLVSYFISSSRTVPYTLAFDLDTETWSVRAPPPQRDTIWSFSARDAFDGGAAAATAAGVHLIFGREHHLYDPAADVWTAMPDAPVSANQGILQAVGDSLFLLSASGGVWKHDGVSWIQRSRWPGSRANAAAAVLGRRIYVGGGTLAWTGSDAFQAYDVVTDTWEDLPDMPLSRRGLAAGTSGGSVCMFGGGFPLSRGSWIFLETLCYDPAAEAWSAGPSLPVPALVSSLDEVGLIGVSAASRNDTIFVAGGGYGDNVDAQVWSNSAGAFLLTPRP